MKHLEHHNCFCVEITACTEACKLDTCRGHPKKIFTAVTFSKTGSEMLLWESRKWAQAGLSYLLVFGLGLEFRSDFSTSFLYLITLQCRRAWGSRKLPNAACRSVTPGAGAPGRDTGLWHQEKSSHHLQGVDGSIRSRGSWFITAQN